MKNILRFALCSLVVFGLVSVSPAQTIYWEIKQHSTDLDLLKQEVSTYVNNGYVPLGITYDNVELYLLYVHDPDFGVQAWSIEWYESRSEVQKGITKNLNQGYIPTGITYTGDLFFVLFLQVETSAEAWRLEPSATDLEAVENAIQPYVSRGYLPVGITAFEGEYWTMLLKIPDTTAEYWLIEEYEVGTHSEYINENIEDGYVPWGMMYRDGLIDMLYIGL